MPRLVCLILCLLCAALGAGQAWAQAPAPDGPDRPGVRYTPGSVPEPLLLAAGAGPVKAWPAVRVLTDPTGQWTLADVRRRSAEFQPPAGPEANLGVQRHPVWLQLPVQVPADGPADWVLQIDYPPLNQVDVYLVDATGRTRLHQRLGNALPFADRPLPSRVHAAPLRLAPGEVQQLYLRVQTASTMVLPISLVQPDDFHQWEAGQQLLHGLLNGFSLALLLYAVAHGWSLRDPVFLHYGLIVLGVTGFFTAYFGLGQQYLWSSTDGLLGKVAPLSVLVALTGGALFIQSALETAHRSPRLHQVLAGVGGLALLGLLASLAGLLDYRKTQLLATALGPVPMLVALPESLRRVRQGDRVAAFLSLGWLSYTVGALTMAGLLRGWLPAQFWTQHLFQFAAVLEMVIWLRVLGLRVQLLRREAERSAVERQALLALAHTDALTGLPNRRGLNAALAQALPAATPQALLAVYLLDLDGFKPVNDRLGHDAGDELLVQVGQRLKAQLRHTDLVARLGGDEFVVMAPALQNEAEATRLGRKLLEAFAQPFEVGGSRCRVGGTVGYALAPLDGGEPGDLLKRADAAMYAGKHAGRHTLRRGAASPGLVT